MPFEVQNKLLRRLQVPAAPQAVFDVLVDVPDSVSHFPDVESLLREGPGNAWTWKLKKLGVGKVSLQTVYACRYENDPGTLSIWWSPLEGIGNARASGRWTIQAAGEGTEITLDNEFEMAFKLPKLMKKVAQGAVVRENTRLIDVYLGNLRKTFSGSDGRLRAGGQGW